jgi:hypothetical protein
MATFTEGIGNYSLAVKYTSLRYTYTGDKYDLARCVEDSILSEKDEYIVEYGEKLIALEDFDEVCAYKEEQYKIENYREYLYGKVASSLYGTGDLEGAITLAENENGLTSFASGNPLMALAVRIITDHDKESASVMIEELEKVTPQNEDEITLLSNMKHRLYSQTVN